MPLTLDDVDDPQVSRLFTPRPRDRNIGSSMPRKSLAGKKVARFGTHQEAKIRRKGNAKGVVTLE